jgi:C4-dicarboxylate-specific signal transduction histidine kinase
MALPGGARWLGVVWVTTLAHLVARGTGLAHVGELAVLIAVAVLAYHAGARAGAGLALAATVLGAGLSAWQGARPSLLAECAACLVTLAVAWVAARAGGFARQWDLLLVHQHEAARRLQAVLAAVPDVLISVEGDGSLALVSPLQSAHWVVEEPTLLAQGLAALLGEGAARHVEGIILGAATGTTATAEFQLARAAGPREVEARAVLDGNGAVLLVLRDITARKQLEQKLVLAEREASLARTRASLKETERLSALGTVAAGIAHEINNPLAVVASGLEFALEELSAQRGTPAEALESLRDAKEGVQRVSAIVRDMKSLSRHGAGDPPAPVDLQRVADAAINLSRGAVRTRATVVRAYGEVPTVYGSETRLGQVLINLLVNAAQAMARPDPTSNHIHVRLFTDAEGRAVLAVEDNGAGIPPEVLGRIFDPFFTTKPQGEGTGLGLSISRTIVEDMRGTLTVESRVGVGTIVSVVLPAPDAEDRAHGEEHAARARPEAASV